MAALRVWGPNLSRLRVRFDGSDTDLERGDDGFWTGPDLAAGTDYWLLLDDSDETLPDPGSRWQPDGVHGPSRVYDQDAFAWHDRDWKGRDLTAAVVYEMHIATFTEDATFDGAISRLDELVELGVTHLEVLPVNGVNGVWNWGYDGVDWYAVHEPIGGPDGFKRFVDAAHVRGLAVVLDVVYNHLGPSGNYLPKFGPIFKAGRNTWGDLIDVENPGVRRFVLDNALMWLRDYHVDALRLDAVHALQDDSPQHILAQLADEVAALQKSVGRPLTLIAESDLNDPMMITPESDGGRGMDAQWDDDVHHALHALLTGERQGYYVDFGSLEVLAKTLTRAFLHDGTYSTFRERVHGAPIDPKKQHGWQFVVCLQDHDQVGNRAVGDRLPEITSPDRLRIGAVLLLTAPFTPMLWMGEEWAASTRWPFFTSHPEPDLAKATAEGRVQEFASHGWDVSQMIDPQDPEAYRTAILNWSERTEGDHARVLRLYTQLIALRAAEPDLHGTDLTKTSVDYDEDAQWIVVHRGGFRIAANLSDEQVRLPVHGPELVLATGAARFDNGALLLGPQSAAIVRLTTR
ncbi:malto-oligosyltrehalose trehalohydrolase [Jatrophihabitans endophyticus]|uniref:malto-oligosyltrehalose trehalohydrolase n=1 Tax=Jatrophihabitans endophyticus TaxID=1206085 RepID=UPI0019FB0874|nr:malto-oligosyltrehalose trehalohydrolase [Jatrophihabitans endophyticus]MBE7186801.1 malto-oligosyltrehalose trehalohydrolase [Jatrophihabitans endophyticus]